MIHVQLIFEIAYVLLNSWRTIDHEFPWDKFQAIDIICMAIHNMESDTLNVYNIKDIREPRQISTLPFEI